MDVYYVIVSTLKLGVKLFKVMAHSRQEALGIAQTMLTEHNETMAAHAIILEADLLEAPARWPE